MTTPLTIKARGLGKKYRKNWLFSNADLEFRTGQSWAILGRNGTGKSTLLKILAGAVLPTEGKVEWANDRKLIELNDMHGYFSITAPYMELVEEFTLSEMLAFHFSLKKVAGGQAIASLPDLAGLSASADVKIKYFSSGMLQRLKLITCLYSDVPVILLDEPCTNLDDEGIQWYRNTIREVKNDRLVIVASNQAHEYDFCDHKVHIEKLSESLQ